MHSLNQNNDVLRKQTKKWIKKRETRTNWNSFSQRLLNSLEEFGNKFQQQQNSSEIIVSYIERSTPRLNHLDWILCIFMLRMETLSWRNWLWKWLFFCSEYPKTQDIRKQNIEVKAVKFSKNNEIPHRMNTTQQSKIIKVFESKHL